jgi:hypothetical protein
MNLLEQHAMQMLRRDPMTEANDDVRHAIGIQLALSADKEDVFSVLGDTHSRITYAECVNMLQQRGFEKIFTETHGERNDNYEIWWHPDGLLLTSESYGLWTTEEHGSRVNMIHVYFNWQPGSREVAYYSRSSGGYVNDQTWSGYIDGREGMFTQLDAIRAGGPILQKWVEAPFLWLLNYSEPRVPGYDYKAINARKLAMFPETVRSLINC